MKQVAIHFSISVEDDPEAAFHLRRERDRLTPRTSNDAGTFGAMSGVDVRTRPLFATFRLALNYCLSESIGEPGYQGIAIAVRYAESAGFEDDIRRRLRLAPRRWLIAGWA